MIGMDVALIANNIITTNKYIEVFMISNAKPVLLSAEQMEAIMSIPQATHARRCVFVSL